MTYSVRTERLGRRFGNTEALRGLDLEVAPGSVLGLLGHNGAGKTTAVRILTTLLAPSNGSGFVAGRHVVREPGAAGARGRARAGRGARADRRRRPGGLARRAAHRTREPDAPRPPAAARQARRG